MSNLRNAGRQSLIITLNFDRVDDKVNEILNFCSNEKAKEKIISFCNDVMRVDEKLNLSNKQHNCKSELLSLANIKYVGANIMCGAANILHGAAVMVHDILHF